jgi:DNA-binding transcriptional LysR family regulator
MELRHLRSFLAVVEEENVTRAAARLFIAQPALSRQLHQLERAVGAQLFERHSRGMRLTAAGVALVPRARTALSAFDAATTQERMRERLHGSALTVGYITDYHGGLIAEIIHRFRERYPEIYLYLRHYDFDNPSAGAVDGSSDIGIHTEALAADGCEFHPIDWIAPMPTALMVSADHPLGQQESVSLQEVERAEVTQCIPPADDPTFQRIWSGFGSGLRPRRTFVPKDFDEYFTNVSAGDMAGLTMMGTVEGTGPVRAVPVVDFPSTRLGLWINSRRPASDTVRLFRDFVRSDARIPVPR